MPETYDSAVKTLSAPASPPASPSKRSVRRTPSLQRVRSTESTSASESVSGQSAATPSTLPPAGEAAPSLSPPLSRQSSLSLNLSRSSSLSKKHAKHQHQHHQTHLDREQVVPPSPSSTHRPQKHVMLNRRSVSQDFQIRLQQQQQRQDDLGEELSEAGEDHIPGTPSSISSFGSSTMDRDKNHTSRHNRMSKNSVALIESRNIQALSSNLAMVNSPTDSEFPQQNSDSLLSVIAQKEARIAQLREDLDNNLSELTQLKERWSQMMIEERNRQQAEASASIQEQERHLYGSSSTQSVSNRLSTTGAGIWGSVVGSVSSISGVSGGITLHNVNALGGSSSLPTTSPTGLISGRSSTSSNPAKGESRPTSPLPMYLNGFSSLNGLNSPVSPVQSNGGLSSASAKRGDRTSLSSLSTCSSSQSNGGDGPTAFEAGHSSQSSISSAGHPDQSTVQLHREQRESRRMKRESSGLFIPPEAEEVLVNTGRALFKGFGSLIGGIRTVVTDVAESDRFQHSRQRTIDMMSGLAQTAADALPLPSHDDIYYHHQRLRLLDEEEEQNLSAEQLQQRQQQQQAREQRRRERQREKERKLQEKAQSGSSSELSGVNRSPSLVRRTSRPSAAKKGAALAGTEGESLSRSASQLSLQDKPKPAQGSSASGLGQDEEEAVEWNIEDRELLESLEADVRDQEKGAMNVTKMEPETGTQVDTPMRTAVQSSTSFTLASKKND
ncbi:hypothetical protein BGZ98_008771 [Dissophora globulifera]|nr:hypothetical protein BGZ98_008771 [Dissophora globulifera]